MADTNEPKRDTNDSGSIAFNVGAVPGDTMATALDPLGSVASAPTGQSLENRSGVGIVDNNNDGSETKQEK
ncbi:hypothetical protein D1B31_02220 [Neobacillus notoginsengisoli]|uniref:Uncharacterized protein n=1 Tax=Neobacillus notoginsengisoli TaxID=1578198 RepID=A0A417Z094_9BACI|nr:hypothetical protein [Neobacillus notoginsengisoli]RHW43495.1 hypothetical protein D1B31_02220 [Neobacillus notoginsengisoli]